MLLVLFLNLVAVVTVVCVARTKGLERALPIAVFFLVLFPEESKLTLPGMFALTTQRFVTITLIALSLLTKKPDRQTPRHLPLKVAVVALGGWWILSAMNSIVFMESLKSVLGQILDYFTVYYIFVRHVTNTATVRKILFGIVGAIVVCSAFGMLEAYAQWTVLSILPPVEHRYAVSGSLYVDLARGLRVQSTFGHPILFGTALAMAIPVALSLVSTTKRRWQRIFLWIGILAMFACIYKTGSRGPWLTLSMSLAALLFFSKMKVRKYLIGITLFSVAVLIFRPGVWETILSNYLSTVDTGSYQGESYLYRFELYDLVVQELNRDMSRAIWGYGPQSFPYLHLHGELNGRPMDFTSCDSSFAAFLVETGYVGLVIAMWPLAIALKRAIQDYRRLPAPYNQLCIVFGINLGAFYFQMISVYLFGWGQQTIMLWVVIALSTVYPYLVASEQRQKSLETREGAAMPATRLVFVGGHTL